MASGGMFWVNARASCSKVHTLCPVQLSSERVSILVLSPTRDGRYALWKLNDPYRPTPRSCFAPHIRGPAMSHQSSAPGATSFPRRSLSLCRRSCTYTREIVRLRSGMLFRFTRRWMESILHHRRSLDVRDWARILIANCLHIHTRSRAGCNHCAAADSAGKRAWLELVLSTERCRCAGVGHERTSGYTASL